MSEEKQVYTLPLAPQNLVEIYKVKEEDEDFVLWVDYLASKEKLSAKHILIYLANTNFKTTFAQVDEDLLLEYIKSDFIIDSPFLGRFVVMAIKARYRYEFNGLEQQLLGIFSKDQLHDFVDKHIDLIDEVCNNMAELIPFVICKFHENLSDENKAIEIEVRDAVDQITVVDKPTVCGPNVARLLTDGWDGFLLVCSMLGFKMQYNKQMYNDKPAYFGKDLFYVLTQANITNNILSMMPPGFITSVDIPKPKTEEEIEADIKADIKSEAEANANDSETE